MIISNVFIKLPIVPNFYILTRNVYGHSDSLVNSNKKSDFTAASGTHQLPWVPNFIISSIQLLFLIILSVLTSFKTHRLNKTTTKHTQRSDRGATIEAAAAVQNSFYFNYFYFIYIFFFYLIYLILFKPHYQDTLNRNRIYILLK